MGATAMERDPDELMEELEAALFQLTQDVVAVEGADVEVTTKLNMIAEMLEDAESAFRKDRTPPYRREGHLIGNLLQVLEQQDEFYPTLESKLSELTDNRVKAAACRVLLATVPVNSRFIVRLLYDEEMLEHMCEYAGGAEPPLRCYATGLLAVGLRDRSVADIVVNKDTPVKLLQRVRLYASKLERERHHATKYIQENLRNANSGRARRVGGSSGLNQGSKASTTNPTRSGPTLKRKFSESGMRGAGEIGAASDGDAVASQVSMVDDSDSFDSTLETSSFNTQQGTDEEQLATAASAGLLAFQPDPQQHEEDLKKIVMLELLYTLDCIGLMGEYLELFAPALKEDIIGTIVTFLYSKNPTVLSHILKLTSHFLAHKKFCFSLVDAGGVDLIFATAKSYQSTGQPGLLDRSLSMCLHGLASSSAVIEKILLTSPEPLLSTSFGLLSSPNDRARQNAVVFYGLTLPFKVVLEHFEKQNGLYTLLNIIRAGNNPKSTVQRQLSHDACLCLRQYLRVNMAFLTHRLRRRLSQLNYTSNRSNNSSTPVLTAAPALARLPPRVPKLAWSKPVDIDDKTHEQNLIFYEKYRYSVPSSSSGTGTWSASSGPGGAMWSPAAKLTHLRGTLVMLEVTAMMATLMQSGDSEESSNTIRMWIFERAQFSLECLRVLTLVVPSLALEVCSTEVVVDEVGAQKRLGLSILLEIATSTNPRDSDLVRDALHVFCNCVSPPHTEDCWQHPHKEIRQYTLTARDMRKKGQDTQIRTNGNTGLSSADEDIMHCCSRVKDDKALRPVRKLARERNAIKVCVQLLRYKRSVQNADAIRLLATRALLGLARDRHIAQILEKMQLGQVLSDLIRQDPVLEENADLHVRFRESALDLISQVTQRAPNAVINEAMDPTVRKIEKASIVAQTKITYDSDELIKLIHDHLLSKGLTESASTLLTEANIDQKSCSPTSSLKTPERRDKPNRHQGDVTTSGSRYGAKESSDIALRPSKIARVGKHTSPDSFDSNEKDASQRTTLSQASGDPPHRLDAVLATLSHAHRRKRIREAFQKPHFFVPKKQPNLSQVGTFQQTKLSKRARQPSISTSITAARITEQSRLDEIVSHYLREQHRQCANPVTTVPPFKLLDSNAVHRCPDPTNSTKTAYNVYSRLDERSRSGFRLGSNAFSSPYSDAGINRYVYSRYRPYRVVGSHGSTHWGVTVARFYGDNHTHLLMGNHDGLLQQVDFESDSIVQEWTCHAPSSAIVDLETNESTRMQSANRLILTGSAALTPFGVSEVAFWDVKSMETARWRFSGGLLPRFNNFGDRIVALDARAAEDDQDMDEEADVTGAVMIDIATGNVLCELKDTMHSNDYKRATNCCFSTDDSTILTGGILWDARIPTRALYKFDKLSNVGYGCFHPNGNEIIINSAVWDLRTFQLLRMVPALDKCNVRFNSVGSVMFSYNPHQLTEDIERRRGRAKTWFRVLDARDYREISTIELERPIYDLSIDQKSSLLSVVEGRYQDAESYVDDDPVCRLYEVGRKRPSEDDSDVEDAHDQDSDAMDEDEFDESESATDEEEEEEEEDDDDDGEEDDDDEEEEGEGDDGYAQYYYDDEGAGDDDGDGLRYVEVDDQDGSEDDEEYEDGDGDVEEDSEQRSPRRHRRRSRTSRRTPMLSARDIHFLLEIPDTEYYDVHDEYSSEEDDEDNDEEEEFIEDLETTPRAHHSLMRAVMANVSNNSAEHRHARQHGGMNTNLAVPGSAATLFFQRRPSISSAPPDQASLSEPKRYRKQPTDLRAVVEATTSQLAHDPTNIKVLMTRATAHFKQNALDPAVHDLDKVLTLDSHNVGAFYTRGLAHSKLNHMDLAIRDFSEALRLRPDHVNAAYARASCYNSKGDFMRAIDDYNFALTQDQKANRDAPHKKTQRSLSFSKKWSDESLIHTPERQLSRQSLHRELSEDWKSNNQSLASPACDPSPVYEGSNNYHDTYERSPSSSSVAASPSLSSVSLSAVNSTIPGVPERRRTIAVMEASFDPSVQGVDLTDRHQDASAEVHHARGFAFRQQGNFEAAADAYTQAIELNPRHFKAYFNRGFAYDKLRRFDQAIDDYTAALTMDPSNAFAYYNRGISLDRSGDYEGALADFTRAIELVPSNADFYHNRGFCHRKQGNFELAIQDYSAAIEYNPNHFKSLYNRAYSYDKLGQYDDAVADYTAALQVEPANANAYHNRGSTYDKMKRTDLAIADFDQAIALQPHAASSNNSRGLCYDQLGRHFEALKDFSRAIAMEPTNAVFYHNRGYCYRNLGEFSLAINDYTEALRFEPRNIAAYNNRGYAYRKLRRYLEAVRDYTTALEIDPNNTRTLSNRAYSFAKMEQFHDAVHDYSAVIALDPHNAYSYHNRAILLDKLGDPVSAQADFAQAAALERRLASSYPATMSD